MRRRDLEGVRISNPDPGFSDYFKTVALTSTITFRSFIGLLPGHPRVLIGAFRLEQVVAPAMR
jgi:hypothetical protein